MELIRAPLRGLRDWWLDVTDVVMLSSPFMERRFVHWRLAAFDFAVTLDAGMFLRDAGYYQESFFGCFAVQFVVTAATVLILLLLPDRLRQYTVRVEVISALALSISMTGITMTHFRVQSAGHWLGYLIAMMMLKAHPVAILAAYIPFLLVGCLSVDHSIDFLYKSPHSKTWAFGEQTLGILLFQPFTAGTCFWYGHVFTSKVRAIRDGNMFSEVDMDPREVDRLLTPGHTLTFLQRVVHWWKRSTNKLITSSPLAARWPVLARFCALMTLMNPAALMHAFAQYLQDIKGEERATAIHLSLSRAALVAWFSMYLAVCVVILAHQLELYGYISRGMKEDVTLTILLLATLWVQFGAPHWAAENCAPWEFRSLGLITLQCLSLGVKEALFVLALAQAHPVVMLFVICALLPVAVPIHVLGAEDGRFAFICALVVAAHLVDHYNLVFSVWDSVERARSNERGLSHCLELSGRRL